MRRCRFRCDRVFSTRVATERSDFVIHLGDLFPRRHFDGTGAQPGREVHVTAGPNGRVRLVVLGPLDVRDPVGREVRSVLAQSKRLALLSYLALAGRDRFRRRDTAVGLFWPDGDQVAARASLRQALSWLRHELGSAALTPRQRP